jgi:hypothetical protein
MTEGTMKTVSGHYTVETVVEVVSLRDQFAMAALPGLIARIGRPNSSMKNMKDVAKVAYELADTLLAVRK